MVASDVNISKDSYNLISDKHPLWLSALLHLFPGLLGLMTYIFIGIPIAQRFSFNPDLSGILFVVPLELGLLLYLSHKRNNDYSLNGIVLYRDRIPRIQIAVFTIVLFLWMLLVAVLFQPVDRYIFDAFFSWMPDWFIQAWSGSYPIGIQLLNLAIMGVMIPVIEELYFRGYLLPRLSYLGNWAPLINTVLFAAHHFWSPWLFLNRVLLGLPAAYIVQKKKNILIAMLLHVIGNSLGIIIAIISNT
ncbi:MAG TPA: CPBP family intramembrane glutamic endopeptidase [Oculatellaceae cyanobacterium]